MGERKMKISDVLRETGLRRNTVTLMYKEIGQKIDIEALDRLCLLFECEVADMLEFIEESKSLGVTHD
jgi:putative transcriptional regulator